MQVNLSEHDSFSNLYVQLDIMRLKVTHLSKGMSKYYLIILMLIVHIFQGYLS